MKTVLEATTQKCVFLTAVEMLPVFLREAPLLALLCASDRLRWWGGDRQHNTGESLRKSSRKKESNVCVDCASLQQSQEPVFMLRHQCAARTLTTFHCAFCAHPTACKLPKRSPVHTLCPTYRRVGALICFRLVHQGGLEVGQVPLRQRVLLDLLLLLPFVFERDHLIIRSQVVPAAAAELRHVCSPPLCDA